MTHQIVHQGICSQLDLRGQGGATLMQGGEQAVPSEASQAHIQQQIVDALLCCCLCIAQHCAHQSWEPLTSEVTKHPM